MSRLALIAGLLLAVQALQAQPRLMVTIAPQLESVRAIAGEGAVVGCLVPPGASPESYSPTAKEMKRLSDTQLYFAIGAPIETALLPKIRGAFPGIRIVDATAGMSFREISEEGGHAHHHSGHDPHVWLSVGNMKVHAANVLQALKGAMPEKAAVYQANYEAYIQSLEVLDRELAAMLSPMAGSAILVFHPAFGYLLESYGIRQISVEADGKRPTPKHLANLSRLVKEQAISRLYVQPQSNEGDAASLASSLGLVIQRLDPLPSDYSPGMRRLAKALSSPDHD